MSLVTRLKKGAPATTGQTILTQRLSSESKPVIPRESQPQKYTFKDLKERIQDKLVAELDPRTDTSRLDVIKRTIQDMYDQILQQESVILSRIERDQLFESIVAEILGFGPLDPLLADETVSEIMVNGPGKVFVERQGKISLSQITFDNNEHLMRVIDRIVSPLGRRIDESSPYVDARLPDGSRVNAIIPPLALNGPTLTVRKFEKDPLRIEDLIRFGSVSAEVAEFLIACVKARLNIVVSGGTGSGKTTLLNVAPAQYRG
jgi:pilus assembly protein CpaF